MDDGLVRQEGGMGYIPGEVLILVVMDDGLVLFGSFRINPHDLRS